MKHPTVVGTVPYGARPCFLSSGQEFCIGEYVGLEEIDDGIWNVYFGPLKPGRLLERHLRIEESERYDVSNISERTNGTLTHEGSEASLREMLGPKTAFCH